MMNKGIVLYGYNARGYWRDVGNPTSYREVLMDIVEGLVKFPIKTPQIKENIFGRENCYFEGARLEGMVVLGSNVLINNDSVIKNCSIGSNVEIGRNTVIENSIIWDNVRIGSNCVIKNAVLCNGVIVGRGCRSRLVA